MRAWVAILLFGAGCGSDPDSAAAHEPANDSGISSPSSDTTPSNTPPGSDTSVTTSPSDFAQGKYLVDHLAIIAEHDRDGDGEIDNNLPLVLNLVSVLLGTGEYTVDAVNEQIAEALYPDNIILMEASQSASVLNIDLLLGSDAGTGLKVEPASYDADGAPLIGLIGVFEAQSTFQTTADAIELPMVLFEGADPVPLRLEQVTLAGELDDVGVVSTLYGVIPIRAMMDEVVEPLIPDEGVDMDGDGENESKEELVELVWSIAPSAGDIDLGGGETGVSATLELAATAASF